MPDYMSDAGLLAHLQIQKQNIGQFKSEAGADTEDMDAITQDCDNMQAIINFCTLADEYKTNAFGIKRTMIRGNIGEPVGTLMSPPSFAPPFPPVSAIEKRSRERDGRFKRSKTMTEAAMLGLDLFDESSNISPDTVKPTLEAFAAQTGYEAAIVVGNRAKSDMWKVLGRRMNSENWNMISSGTGKSADIQITPTTPGQPERIELKILLYKANEPYGQPSDPVYVTFNP